MVVATNSVNPVSSATVGSATQAVLKDKRSVAVSVWMRSRTSTTADVAASSVLVGKSAPTEHVSVTQGFEIAVVFVETLAVTGPTAEHVVRFVHLDSSATVANAPQVVLLDRQTVAVRVLTPSLTSIIVAPVVPNVRAEKLVSMGLVPVPRVKRTATVPAVISRMSLITVAPVATSVLPVSSATTASVQRAVPKDKQSAVDLVRTPSPTSTTVVLVEPNVLVVLSVPTVLANAQAERPAAMAFALIPPRTEPIVALAITLASQASFAAAANAPSAVQGPKRSATVPVSTPTQTSTTVVLVAQHVRVAKSVRVDPVLVLPV